MSFGDPERRATGVIRHTYAIGSSVHRGAAPVALTKDLPASMRNHRRLSGGERLVDADRGSA
jgi:hypothetical protein